MEEVSKLRLRSEKELEKQVVDLKKKFFEKRMAVSQQKETNTAELE